MAWQIRNRSSNDKLAIDATSYAARVTPYDSRGINRGAKATYAASNPAAQAVAVTATVPFAQLIGSATKTVRLQKCIVSGLASTAVATVVVGLVKTSTAASGGTPVGLTELPFVTGSATVTAVAQMFSAAPTAGTAVGTLGAQALTLPLAGTSASDAQCSVVFDFANGHEMETPTLVGVAETFEVRFGSAVANAPSMVVTWIWTEE